MRMSGDCVGQMLSIQITGSRFYVQVFGLSLRVTSCKEIFFDADRFDWAGFTQGTQDLFLLQRWMLGVRQGDFQTNGWGSLTYPPNSIIIDQKDPQSLTLNHKP